MKMVRQQGFGSMRVSKIGKLKSIEMFNLAKKVIEATLEERAIKREELETILVGDMRYCYFVSYHFSEDSEGKYSVVILNAKRLNADEKE